MRSSLLLPALIAPSAFAFPWLKPEGLEALLNHPEARAEVQRQLQSRDSTAQQPRQLGTGLLPGLVDLLEGTLQAVLDPILGLIPTQDSVKGLKKFPEGMIDTERSSSVTDSSQQTTHSKPPALLISAVPAPVSTL